MKKNVWKFKDEGQEVAKSLRSQVQHIHAMKIQTNF